MDFTQNYNRYSYCLNNPLKYTDPSGEIVWFVPESEVFYKIANAELIPLGELVEKKSFVRATFSNDTAKWHVRTVIVMESDTLETVSVSTIGKRLIIKIETEPYDNPDWWDLEKLTNYYDIKFDVIGLKKGMYNAELHMNNTSTYRDSLVLE